MENRAQGTWLAVHNKSRCLCVIALMGFYFEPEVKATSNQ